MLASLIAGLAALLLALPVARAQAVATYHGDASRSGNFAVPGLTWERARGLHLDPGFHPRFPGHLYAQPLFWQGRLIVATEDDEVAAIDARNGRPAWHRALGRPVPLSALPCGNIDPLGITGTPVIDAARRTIYLDAVVDEGGGMHHRVFALSLDDGHVLPGWPVDIAAALAAKGEHFDARFQNQRGALALFGGRVYVAFGGHWGDCGDYRGWVVGIGEADPHEFVAWHTRAPGGAIWGQGGVVSDGKALYVATGNTMGARNWSDGEAVIRLAPDLRHDDDPADFFAPSDWRRLDARDQDLGGSSPLPLDLANAGGTQHLILALGKDRRAYLADRDRLGGIGGQLVTETVADSVVITAPAAYPAPARATPGIMVAFHAAGAHCPVARDDNALTVLKITAGTPPRMTTAWCGALRGAGSAMVTTTDGRADPIVWLLGAEGDERLHGYRGDTGAPLVESRPLAGLHHFQTLIAAAGRLYVGADGRLYAFAF
jgi:outer membrane protein assembly factor BamB